jgi:hypothetical protein
MNLCIHLSENKSFAFAYDESTQISSLSPAMVLLIVDDKIKISG